MQIEINQSTATKMEVKMFRQALPKLVVLIGVVICAACSPGQTSPTTEPNMPNPASVHCEQSGGKLEMVQDADGGTAGVCIFPDGSQCEEWAFFRDECKPGGTPATPGPSVAPTAVSPSPASKPSALRVAYSKGNGVALWSEGQAPRLLADANNVEQVRISDDGQVVAYIARSAPGGYELFAVNADGTNQRRLVGQDYLQNIQAPDRAVSFDFAPASHTLYFVTDQYDLHRVNADNGAPASIFGAGQGGFFSFSPDGQWITLYHPNELALAHLDGSEARVVFQYPEDFQYILMGPEIVWKGDSSGFYLASASGPQGSSNNMSVWFIPLAGEPVKQMSYTGPYGAELSPDGRSVVYVYFQHEPVDVHVVTANGEDVTFGSYANANIAFMGWAPDSKHFLLNLSQDGRLALPYLCALGEQPIKLTDADDALPIVWVDAQRVLFAERGRALRLQSMGTPSVLLDADASSWFDYAGPSQ
jgi:putative hemolysin